MVEHLDIALVQMMLGSSPKVAVQDPSYPVYVDTSVIMGMTGDFNEQNSNYGNIQYMPCTPDNGFFPDLSAVSSHLCTSKQQTFPGVMSNLCMFLSIC